MTNGVADSALVRRLGAAARAAWWTFLIGVALAILQALAYLVVSHCEVVWSGLANLMNMEPDDANYLALDFMIAVRLILIVLLIVALFLSFWVHRLRRLGDA
jgi:hypothetical protein